MNDVETARVSAMYEYFSKHANNTSGSAKEILSKIKNGYVPNEKDVFELIETDQKKIDKYKAFYDIRQRIRENGKVSEEDLKFLVNELGLDKDLSADVINNFNKSDLVN